MQIPAKCSLHATERIYNARSITRMYASAHMHDRHSSLKTKQPAVATFNYQERKVSC